MVGLHRTPQAETFVLSVEANVHVFAECVLALLFFVGVFFALKMGTAASRNSQEQRDLFDSGGSAGWPGALCKIG